MTLYIDIILLENILMNFIILFATGIALKINLKQWRLMVSSVIGAIYAIIVYLELIEIVTHFFMKILLSVCMVYVAFSPKNVKKMFKQLLMFYLISFVFGGCAFALLYFVKPQNVLMKNGVYIGQYPIKIALLSGIVGFIIIQIAFKFIKNRLTKDGMYCKVKIIIKNNDTDINCLVDSGNLLKDPIMNLPVIVVEKEKLREILPSEILDNIELIKKEGDLKCENNLINEYITRIRLVPFSSIGKQNGLLLGIKADKIIVTNFEEEEIELNAIIAIYEKTISKNGYYSGLIGLDVIEGRCYDEFNSNCKGKYNKLKVFAKK